MLEKKWVWPVWLSWLERRPVTGRWRLEFEVGVHTWVAGRPLVLERACAILVWVRLVCNQLVPISCIDVSVSLFLSKSNGKKKVLG